MKQPIVLFSLLALTFSCTEKLEKKPEILCWFNSDAPKCAGDRDTVKLSGLQSYVAQQGDTMLGTTEFEFEGKKHIMSVHSDLGRVESGGATDGGGEFYVLDKLGVIYYKGWFCYHSMKTNSDSLNRILAEAYDRVVAYDRLHPTKNWWTESHYSEETVQFVEPKTGK